MEVGRVDGSTSGGDSGMRRSFFVLCQKNSTPKGPSWHVIPTTTETVFTINEMDENINFQQWHQEATRLFSSESRYIPPKEFGYKLPNEGIAEYAFIGRLKCTSSLLFNFYRSNAGKSTLVDYLLGNKKIGEAKFDNFLIIYISEYIKTAWMYEKY